MLIWSGGRGKHALEELKQDRRGRHHEAPDRRAPGDGQAPVSSTGVAQPHAGDKSSPSVLAQHRTQEDRSSGPGAALTPQLGFSRTSTNRGTTKSAHLASPSTGHLHPSQLNPWSRARGSCPHGPYQPGSPQQILLPGFSSLPVSPHQLSMAPFGTTMASP